jgi:YHS domain-containing protein
VPYRQRHAVAMARRPPKGAEVMSRLTTSVAALALVIGLTGSAAAKTAPKKMAAAPKCPACKMALSAKKTKTNTKAVKINGKTYYCCDKCDMSKKKA